MSELGEGGTNGGRLDVVVALQLRPESAKTRLFSSSTMWRA